MDNEQENQYRMGGQLVAFLQARAADLTPSPAAVAEAADIQPAYEAVAASLGQGTASTTTNTSTAEDLQEKAIVVIAALLGPLRSVARKLVPDPTEATALLARATIKNTQLRRLRPDQLRDVLEHLLLDAATYQKELSNYGYTAAVHAVVQQQVAAFAATVGTTRALLKTSQGTHATTADLLKAFLQQCYELDDPMLLFVALNPDLHRDYLIARKVGKSGGGGGKKGKGGGGTV